MTSIMEQHKKNETLPFCLGILLIAFLLQIAGWLKGDRLVFPGTLDILRAFFRLLGEGRTWLVIRTTLFHLLEAVAVSTLIGLAIGTAEGISPFIRTLLKPLMILLRSIPMIILVVIIMVLFRYDRVPLIAPSLLLVPMISEATAEGFLRIDPDLMDVYRMDSDFNFWVFRHVHLRLMAGYLWQAYTNTVGMGLKLVVTTEYLVQTRNSLGKAVYNSNYLNEYEEVYAYALMMVFLVLFVSALPRWIEKAFTGD